MAHINLVYAVVDMIDIYTFFHSLLLFPVDDLTSFPVEDSDGPADYAKVGTQGQ